MKKELMAVVLLIAGLSQLNAGAKLSARLAPESISGTESTLSEESDLALRARELRRAKLRHAKLVQKLTEENRERHLK